MMMTAVCTQFLSLLVVLSVHNVSPAIHHYATAQISVFYDYEALNMLGTEFDAYLSCFMTEVGKRLTPATGVHFQLLRTWMMDKKANDTSQMLKLFSEKVAEITKPKPEAIFQDTFDFPIFLSGKNIAGKDVDGNNWGTLCGSGTEQIILLMDKTTGKFSTKKIIKRLIKALARRFGLVSRERDCKSRSDCCHCDPEKVCILKEMDGDVPDCLKRRLDQLEPECLMEDPDLSKSYIKVCGNKLNEAGEVDDCAGVENVCPDGSSFDSAPKPAVTDRVNTAKTPGQTIATTGLATETTIRGETTSAAKSKPVPKKIIYILGVVICVLLLCAIIVVAILIHRTRKSSTQSSR